MPESCKLRWKFLAENSNDTAIFVFYGYSPSFIFDFFIDALILMALLGPNRFYCVMVSSWQHSEPHDHSRKDTKSFKSLFFYYPENEIFYVITSEFSNWGNSFRFMYCQKTKVTLLLIFRVSYNQWNT